MFGVCWPQDGSVDVVGWLGCVIGEGREGSEERWKVAAAVDARMKRSVLFSIGSHYSWG